TEECHPPARGFRRRGCTSSWSGVSLRLLRAAGARSVDQMPHPSPRGNGMLQAAANDARPTALLAGRRAGGTHHVLGVVDDEPQNIPALVVLGEPLGRAVRRPELAG